MDFIEQQKLGRVKEAATHIVDEGTDGMFF
jgi:hypothetical protein